MGGERKEIMVTLKNNSLLLADGTAQPDGNRTKITISG